MWNESEPETEKLGLPAVSQGVVLSYLRTFENRVVFREKNSWVFNGAFPRLFSNCEAVASGGIVDNESALLRVLTLLFNGQSNCTGSRVPLCFARAPAIRFPLKLPYSIQHPG